MLNRNILVLGEPTLSERAALFNWGLRVGGALLMGVRVGLGRSVRHWSMLPVTIAGVLLAAGVALASVDPASAPDSHRQAALLVFLGGWFTCALFTAALWLAKPARLARWLAVPSWPATLTFAIFLWLPSLLEGSVFVAVTAWVLTFCWSTFSPFRL
ncbi:MAG: hypothetical protein IT329_17830 [Caldilineaceae bacterium]|nr:hypothetical protein [Caldilineaceae bacterium]